MTVLCLVPAWLGAQQLWETVGGGTDRMANDLHTDTAAGKIYLVGDFKFAGGIPVYHSVAWDGQNWEMQGLGLSFRDSCPQNTACADVHWVTDYDGDIYVGGQVIFPIDSTLLNSHITRFDGVEWQPFGVSNSVATPVVCNGKLFALGMYMHSLNGVTVNNIAIWQDSVWAPFGGPFDWMGGGLITAEHYLGDYYFAGNFGHLGPYNEIVRWDGQNWHPLAKGLYGQTWINRLKAYKGLMYVGGEFNWFPGNADDYLMAWDGNRYWPTFPDVQFVGQVKELEVIDDKLYIVGLHYTRKDGVWQGPYSIAKWDGETYCSFGGPNIQIEEVAGLNGEIYIVTNPVASPGSLQCFARYLGGPQDEVCIPQALPTATTSPIMEATMTVHPNPASGTTELSWEADPTSAAQITILSADGKMVQEMEVQPTHVRESLKLDLQNLAPGVYFVHIANGLRRGSVRLAHF